MGAQHSAKNKVKVAIIGSGNIGSDLMYKLLKQPGHMELVLLTGIDPASEGLARGRSSGIPTSPDGIKAALENPRIKLYLLSNDPHPTTHPPTPISQLLPT